MNPCRIIVNVTSLSVGSNMLCTGSKAAKSPCIMIVIACGLGCCAVHWVMHLSRLDLPETGGALYSKRTTHAQFAAWQHPCGQCYLSYITQADSADQCLGRNAKDSRHTRQVASFNRAPMQAPVKTDLLKGRTAAASWRPSPSAACLCCRTKCMPLWGPRLRLHAIVE